MSEMTKTSDWPVAKLATDFRISQKSNGVFEVEFGRYDKYTKEMTIVSQVTLELDTLTSLATSIEDVEKEVKAQEADECDNMDEC